VVPLVKAVQELNMKQESQIAQLKSENEALKSEVGTLYASQAGLTTENTDVKERLSQLEHLQELLVTQLARLQKQETAAASLAGN
jgi:regulator of replication initiation timing